MVGGTPPNYSTMDDAAAAALFRLLSSRLPGTEELGAVIPQGAGYGFTQPMNTARQTGSHSRATVPANLVALYHNHPPRSRDYDPNVTQDRSQNKFSPNDVDVANRLDVPSYIAVDKGNPITAELLKYLPGSAQSGGVNGVKGEPVLAELPIRAILAYMARKR